MPSCLPAGYKYLLRSISSAATDAQTCITGGLEENQTNDQAAASPVISCEEHIADSSKITCDKAPEFRPFLLGTGYCFKDSYSSALLVCDNTDNYNITHLNHLESVLAQSHCE